MEITLQQLTHIMPHFASNIARNKHYAGTSAETIVSLLNKYAKEFEINTPKRWQHFLAQIAHESGEFRYTEEIASGKAYEGRKDLGNVKTGDGVKYKGRGLIQLTGRANYTTYKGYCGFDVVSQPELIAKPVGSIRSSMWFWQKHNLNYYADIEAFTTITKAINGGTNGWSSRKTYLTKAKIAI